MGVDRSNYAIWIFDEGGTIRATDVHWYNNVVYNWGDGNDYIAYIEGTGYTTAAAFDASTKTDADGTSVSDPQLEDINNQEYWPADTNSYVWEAGYNHGTAYKTYLLETSDFSTTPPAIETQEEGTHNIGAYTLTGSPFAKSSKSLSPPSQSKDTKINSSLNFQLSTLTHDRVQEVYCMCILDKTTNSRNGRMSKSICFISRAAHFILFNETEKIIGGAEFQQVVLARALQKMGWRVSFITEKYDNITSTEVDGIKVLPVIDYKRKPLY